MTCQIRAVDVNMWYLKQLGFRLSVYDVVLGRGTDNPPREDRLTQQVQNTPGNCMLVARRCTLYASSFVFHARDAQ